MRPVTRKVVNAERGSFNLGGISKHLTLECGHRKEINGWGAGAGIDVPARSVCYECTKARDAKLPSKPEAPARPAREKAPYMRDTSIRSRPAKCGVTCCSFGLESAESMPANHEKSCPRCRVAVLEAQLAARGTVVKSRWHVKAAEPKGEPYFVGQEFDTREDAVWCRDRVYTPRVRVRGSGGGAQFPRGTKLQIVRLDTSETVEEA